MKVWIIHQHAIPPSRPGHTRPFDYARALQELGNEVFIITSNFNHVSKLHEWLKPGEKCRLIICDGVPFLWIKTPGYSGNTIGRVWDMFIFAAKLWIGMGLKLLPKPDLIIGSSPPPFGVVSGLHIARRLGVPFILDVRDLWPETLIQLGGGSKYNPFMMMLKLAELHLYKRADYIVTVLPNAMDYFITRGGKENRISWLPNGVNSEQIIRIRSEHSDHSDGSSFVVIYAGALGIANAIDSIIYAAKILQEQGYAGTDVLIRLVGDGTEKKRLMDLTRSLGLNNVVFDDPVQKRDIFNVLESADALIVTLKDIDLYKYGMSLNKLHDYMAAGRPVIFGAKIGRNPVQEAGAGITVAPEDSYAMAEAIKTLRCISKEQLQEIGKLGQEYVLANHNIKVLANELNTIMRTVIVR